MSATLRAVEVGGLNPRAAPSRDGVLVLLFSEDLPASERAVVRAGGRVVLGPYDFPGGRRFHFRDTEGNELAVFSASDGGRG